MSAITLLDGATGTELRARGAQVPSHRDSIWSALALIEAPETVVDVHRAYIDAGADVITANNYAVTPPLLAREGLERRLDELTLRAVELAEEARRDSTRSVRLAGSLPPLETSYRTDLVGTDEAILADYRRLVELLAPRVDILLIETMSCAREAVAALTAARDSGPEVWVSFTLQGNRPGLLPGGEKLEDALDALAELPLDALLVNCCGANLATSALPTLSSRAAVRGCAFGAYANADEVELCGDYDPADPELVERRPLGPEAYASHARRWLEAGATILGGCCDTRPAHLARLRELTTR